MPVTIVAGAQWGDEGKGRIVDLLAAEAAVVVRCQGGPNAGHTVITERGKFALHSVPSGIFRDGVRCVIGAGTVLSPGGLKAELAGLAAAGLDIERVLISERAHLILPYHRALEAAEESRRSGSERVGPTGQGIGPAYTDKAARCGLCAGDLRDMAALVPRVREAVRWKNEVLACYGAGPVSEEEAVAELEEAAPFLAPLIGDTVRPLSEALTEGKRVMLEGQLGVMRDVDWGAYPFVTSSSPTPAGMAAAAGVPLTSVDRIIGVIKAYTTAVGAGPFPTELGEDAWLRERGDEYGATTGRPRRCGWFDAVAVAWAARVAGFTELALTKIDVLDGVDPLPVCVRYRDGGSFPTTEEMVRVEPVYADLSGWRGDTSAARTMEGLPAEAAGYIDEIERRVGVPITLVSVGPEREAVIRRTAPIHRFHR